MKRWARGKGHQIAVSACCPRQLLSLPLASKLMCDTAALSLDMLCVVVSVTPAVLQEFITETRPTGREQERSAERTSEASSTFHAAV